MHGINTRRTFHNFLRARSTVGNERGYLIDVPCESFRKEKEPVENPRDSGSTRGDPTAESLGWHESRWSRPALTQPNVA